MSLSSKIRRRIARAAERLASPLAYTTPEAKRLANPLNGRTSVFTREGQGVNENLFRGIVDNVPTEIDRIKRRTTKRTPYSGLGSYKGTKAYSLG